jgi:hypothetical protein
MIISPGVVDGGSPARTHGRVLNIPAVDALQHVNLKVARPMRHGLEIFSRSGVGSPRFVARVLRSPAQDLARPAAGEGGREGVDDRDPPSPAGGLAVSDSPAVEGGSR